MNFVPTTLYRKAVMTSVFMKKVLSFKALTDGQDVVLVHSGHKTHIEMLKAHTGTIEVIDGPGNTITFNFPNKIEEPVATMSLSAFNFPDWTGTEDKTFYLIEADVMDPTCFKDAYTSVFRQPPRRDQTWTTATTSE